MFTYFDCDYSGNLSPAAIKKGLMNLKIELDCDGDKKVAFKPNDNVINLFVAYGMDGNSNQLSVADFAREVMGGLNERFNKKTVAQNKNEANDRACRVKNGQGPTAPKADEE